MELSRREELAKTFNVTLNEFHRVKDLGKFENEHWSTLYFYDCMLDGDTGEIEAFNPHEIIFKLSNDEIALFNAEKTPYFHMQEMEQGFILGQFIDKKSFDLFSKIVSRESEETNG